jgi:exopolysaccharide production protein ExoZ
MRLNALQALRAHAAAMVVFVHAISTYIEKIGDVESMNLPQGLGQLGVKIFFCISGFIIYNSTEKLTPCFSSAREFILRRGIRIAPLYWIATLVYVIKLSAQGNIPGFDEILKSILFIPYGDGHGMMRPVLGVGWSLNFEMMFYGIFFFSILFSVGTRFFFITATLIILSSIHYTIETVSPTSANINPVYLITDYFLYYFLAGVLLAKLEERFNTSKYWIKTTQNQSLALTALIIIGYFFYTATHSIDLQLLEAMMLLCSVACIFSCMIENQENEASSSPASKILSLAGDASYSTYLTHGFVMGPAARLIHILKLEINPLIFSFSMIFICTAAGVIVHLYVEKPTLRYLNSVFLKKRSSPKNKQPLATD